MDNQELIREQMENTRNSLTEKLETLEDRVATTVQGATEEVAQTVEAVTGTVQETVETVRETVQETLSAVKEGVGSVKGLFDFERHMDRHPWVIVGGSVVFGYLIGELLVGRTRQVRPPGTASLATPDIAVPPRHNGKDKARRHEAHAERKEGWLDQFKPELNKLKGLAVGALMGTVKEMVLSRAQPELGQQVAEILDSFTQKMGGAPVAMHFAAKEEEEESATRSVPSSEVRQPNGPSRVAADVKKESRRW